MSDLELIKKFPMIQWTQPIHVVLADKEGWACRLCIANKGLKGTDTDRLFKNYGKFFRHLREEHPSV